MNKISELEGALLDAAVAKAQGLIVRVNDAGDTAIVMDPGRPEPYRHNSYTPSSLWAVGGPIIEREHIAVYSLADAFGSLWAAGYNIDAENGEFYSADSGFGAASIVMKHHSHGNTPLIAAMRAYVASKFGEEIEL